MQHKLAWKLFSQGDCIPRPLPALEALDRKQVITLYYNEKYHIPLQ